MMRIPHELLAAIVANPNSVEHMYISAGGNTIVAKRRVVEGGKVVWDFVLNPED